MYQAALRARRCRFLRLKNLDMYGHAIRHKRRDGYQNRAIRLCFWCQPHTTQSTYLTEWPRYTDGSGAAASTHSQNSAPHRICRQRSATLRHDDPGRRLQPCCPSLALEYLASRKESRPLRLARTHLQKPSRCSRQARFGCSAPNLAFGSARAPMAGRNTVREPLLPPPSGHSAACHAAGPPKGPVPRPAPDQAARQGLSNPGIRAPGCGAQDV